MNHYISELTAWFYNVFVAQFDGWIALGFVAQLAFTMRFVVQWIASERVGTKRYSGRVLVLLDRRRAAASHLCDQAAGPGIHSRPGAWPVHLRAQSRFDLQDKTPGGKQSGMNFQYRINIYEHAAD